MKKMSMSALLFAVFAVLFLFVCNKKLSSNEVQAETVPQQQTVPMDASEIAAVEAAFDVGRSENGELKINPANCFLTSFYESIDKLELQAFLRYFPGSEMGSQQELEALRNFRDWPFSDCEKLSDMPVPLHRYAGEDVRAALKKYGDVSMEELDYKNAPGVYYLEEYDAFYNYTSDFGLCPLNCVRGEKQGDRLYLYSEEYGDITVKLTLEKQDEDYIVISRMPVEDE